MSPVTCAGALASVKYLRDHNDLRIRHHERAATLTKMLGDAGIEVFADACTHIVPVMVRDPFKCKAMSDSLLNNYGIYVQSINYPTVAEGTERLRFAPTPYHTDSMMSDLVVALGKVFNEHS
jgi:5-aminolevulinate synthase